MCQLHSAPSTASGGLSPSVQGIDGWKTWEKCIDSKNSVAFTTANIDSPILEGKPVNTVQHPFP